MSISDPHGIEGPAGASDGLGFLDYQTEIQAQKILRSVSAIGIHDQLANCVVEGYEIHAGISYGPALNTPLFACGNQRDGCMDATGGVLATYIHGIFNHASAQQVLLRWAGFKKATAIDYAQIQEESINRLADTLEKSMDMPRLIHFFAE
jgi:adenosylcobyric acid synthase